MVKLGLTPGSAGTTDPSAPIPEDPAIERCNTFFRGFTHAAPPKDNDPGAEPLCQVENIFVQGVFGPESGHKNRLFRFSFLISAISDILPENFR
jgi:hypothetical protein